MPLPQPPAASQASLSAPFSVCSSQEVCSSWELEQLDKLTTLGIKTPDASRFRLPESKRSGSKGGTDAGFTPASGATARPTPRFAPSWQSRSHTRSASVVGRRFHSHAPLLLQNRNHQDPFEGGGDAIEDGSSPIQGPPQTPQTPQMPQRRLDEGDDGPLLVVRESPTAARTKQLAQPLHLPRPGIFSVSAGARRRKQRLELEDEIEDVAPSRSHSGSEGEGASQGEDNSGESAGFAANTTPRSAATSVPPGRPPLAEQKTSAARLLSSIQPLKRRRLFVSPGLITSSPPIAGSDQDDGESGGGGGDVDVDVDVDVNDSHEARNDGRPLFVPLFKIKTGNKLRHGWDGDDIVDAESSSGSGDDGGRYGNEEIRDIVDYGALLEYADSSDDDGHGHATNKVDNENSDNYEDDAMMDDDHDEDRRENDYDEDMILDQTPPRIRRARQRQQEKEQEQEQEQEQEHQQQQEQKRLQSQRQRLPTFQRARLFMTRKSTDQAGDDADAEGESLPDGESTKSGGEHTSDQDLTTPARQQHYYDAVLHQPPPDFFSPQQKRRRKQKRPRHSRHSNDDEMDGLDGLASPSATAAAAITAPEQYVPGGLAASLRDWLLQVKSDGGMHTATSMPTAAGGLGRFVVDEARQMPGMVRLAVGRRLQKPASKRYETETAEAMPLARLLLAGAGRPWTTDLKAEHSAVDGMNDISDGPSGDAEPPKQTVVSISHPAWEIPLAGQLWIVASDWCLHEELRDA